MGGNLLNTAETTSPWVNGNGIVAHPKAPVGGGGNGYFCSPSSLGCPGNDSSPIPHPLSPVGRNLNPSDTDIMKLAAAGIPLDTSQKTKTSVLSVSIKEKLNKPEDSGDLIFNASNYNDLYGQVNKRATEARNNADKEAGRVQLNWEDISFVPTGGGDDDVATQVSFKILLTTTLPTWTTLNSQPQEHQAKFNRWRSSIENHEKRHVEIYKKHLETLLRKYVIGPTQRVILNDQTNKAIEDVNVYHDELDRTGQPAGLEIPGGTQRIP